MVHRHTPPERPRPDGVGPSLRPRCARASGFTLIEILIVIAIISLLSSFVLVGIHLVQKRALEALAESQLTSLRSALESYYGDEGAYPGAGAGLDSDENGFPVLFAALFGERRPHGPGGRGAPYSTSVSEKDVAVWDADAGAFRKAMLSELNDDRVEKFVLDPWAQPYVYRVPGTARGTGPWRFRQGPILYSTGPNGVDETVEDLEGADDILR